MMKNDPGTLSEVLVVDDQRETLDLITDYLNEKGFEVISVVSGEEALGLLQEKNFQIAIIDLHLPGLNGTELLKTIKKIKPSIQVIMITGYGTIRDAVECMKLGASDFITKPILLDHLHMTMKRILEEALLKERAELAAYYENLSRIDELTGLFNFRHLTMALLKEVERHLRYDHTLSLAMIDIDNFKEYNDTRGHEQGNELLMSLSHILRHNTRNCDILARYGGEEFVIIFPETSPEEAAVVSQRIRNTVEQTLDISVTIGLASLPKDTKDHNDLIRIADTAMYWGKNHGKNQITIYDEAMSMCK
ncbi:MAG: diguanylate cyclase [Deltaproteobacteria bacterium]|nr:diguanylate cyclase [Deltaproteobacteria bacterium]